MKRRDFVSSAAMVGLAAAAFPGTRTPRAATAAREYDCIVIGGGFAGTTAARELGRAGLRSVILEARSRLGGRTFSAAFADHKIELGGTWVHWSQPHVWAELMRYGMEVIETPGAAPDEFIFLEDDKAKRSAVAEVWGDFAQSVDRFCAEAGELFPRPFDPFMTESRWWNRDHLTVTSRLQELNLDRRQHYFADSFFGAAGHNYPDLSGYVDPVRWYALAGLSAEGLMNATTRYKLKDGTAALIDRMIAEGKPDVHLGTMVEKVIQSGDRVSVVTNSGEYRASALIVTVPMNVLKNIDFSPPLSDLKISASREEHGGHGTKAYIQVRGDVGSLFVAAPGNDAFQCAFTYAQDPAHTLLVAFGPSREAINVSDKNAVARWLEKFLPGVEVENSFGYDWIRDPFSLGTWCMFKPMQASRYWRALQEPEGRLFFASADSAYGWRGFIDGAIESGLRVGYEVVRQLS